MKNALKKVLHSKSTKLRYLQYIHHIPVLYLHNNPVLPTTLLREHKRTKGVSEPKKQFHRLRV